MINNWKISLNDLGWNEELEKEFTEFKDKYNVGRVVAEYKNRYRLYTLDGEIMAMVSGKIKYNAKGREDYPAVGDWAIIDRTKQDEGNAVIHSILPRKSKFSRKVAGKEIEEQILAVNVDTPFICMSLNNDFNLRRLERYLIMAWDSGSIPVILLTKADLCNDIDDKIEQVKSVAFETNIHVISTKSGLGVENLRRYITRGKTVAFLGSSGVGKSTLINYLAGNKIFTTQEIRDDDKGRHTTTHRELVLLPEGGMVIDTPGMREFQILDTVSGLDNTFDDIQKLALQCKFNNCRHLSEPGCEVRNAIEDGRLSLARFNNYQKLKREAEYIERKRNKKDSFHKKSLKKFYNGVKKQF